jgi:hypothetical protein
MLQRSARFLDTLSLSTNQKRSSNVRRLFEQKKNQDGPNARKFSRKKMVGQSAKGT